jgi:PhoH-like ATPase
MSAKKSPSTKIYILDTNVLLYDPRAIFSFVGELVGIPAVVLEELDKFKHEGTDRGRNAREIIRILDDLRSQGSLSTGVTLENGTTVKVIFFEKIPNYSSPFSLDINDNEIILSAVGLQKQGYQVTFITKDLNARIKADVLGIDAEDYLKEHISQESFYKGWITIPVPAVQLKREFPEELQDLVAEKKLALNQFVLMTSRSNPYNYRVFRYLGGKQFKNVVEPQFKWPLHARNPQQLMALDLLLDNSIQLVSLLGPAGTGKTFLALLAGLHKVLIEHEYKKILVSRPVIPLGRDIGYLPGDMQEKLYNWMLPIYDNMEYIIHASGPTRQPEQIERPYREDGDHSGKRRKRHHERHERRDRAGGGHLIPLEEMVRQNKISLEAITYMRGRSIPYQYILIDEVQNLSPHEVKTLISRVGEGSKIILAGDPYQIDSPYLDFSSNGLVVASERFKSQQLFGTVFLESSERSTISKLASELL